jgi:recombination associated protein RdgC
VSFASGPVTFRRYYIVGSWPSRPDDGLVESLREHAFGKHGVANPDGTEIGWVSADHVFDTDLTIDKIEADRFMHLQMRVDKTAAPASIVRSYTKMEESIALGSSAKDFLDKRERKLAREQAVSRAEKEARAGLFRRISTVPVLIDMPAKCVYFGHSGNAASDHLVGLFRDTFDLPIEPATSDQIAHRIMEAAGDSRAVEDAVPFHLVQPPGFEDDDGFDFNDQTFFGREFLTWLWFTSEQNGALFKRGGQSATVAIAKMMQLDCDFKTTGSDTIRSDAPAATPEAKAAIGVGKQPTKMGLLIGASSGEYAFVIDGPRFNVSGLRLPDSEQADPRAIAEERFQHVVDVAGILDMMFALFLGRRSSRKWVEELNGIKAWATGRSKEQPKSNDRNLKFVSEPVG